MSEIRNFARDDAPAVAGLFQRTFRDSDRPAPLSLEAYFAEAYLDHPWFDPEIASRVHVDDDAKVTGFIGVFPGRFEYRGEPFRAAIAGSLMVENYAREPLAGAKLLRSVIRGPQDISISETTNLMSQRLWEPLGGTVLPLLSLDWFRVLRPAGAAVAALAEVARPAAMLAPFAKASDWIGRSWMENRLTPGEPSARAAASSDLSDADFTAAVLELSHAVEFRPAWSAEELAWLLSQAARKERYGDLRRAVVRNRKGGLVGCYIYHGRANAIGRVLQALSLPGAAGDVLDCLFHEADRAGFSGLRGRSSPQLIDALLTRNCVFVHRASTFIHSANRRLVDASMSGAALLTGLAGESWTRLVGGTFV